MLIQHIFLDSNELERSRLQHLTAEKKYSVLAAEIRKTGNLSARVLREIETANQKKVKPNSRKAPDLSRAEDSLLREVLDLDSEGAFKFEVDAINSVAETMESVKVFCAQLERENKSLHQQVQVGSTLNLFAWINN